MLVPGVGALLFKPLHHIAERAKIFETFAAGIAIKNDDGHAPETLTRNAPVRALFDHFVHAVFAPGGKPFHLMDFLERFLAKSFLVAVGGLVHLDEPLLSGAEDDRIVTAPAMGVAVPVIVVAEKRAAVGE